jgi:hypothetical protein
MADIFISYASEDRELAAALAGKLTSRGYSVWWDHHLVGGSQFRDVIHEQLKSSRVTLVIWTAHSLKSAWVKDEADEALRLNKIIPLFSDDLQPTDVPLGHRSNHILPLKDFEGLLRALRTALGGSQKLAPEHALRTGGLAMAEATSLAWRYSYEYGLHIAICFILVPIVVDLLNRVPASIMDNPVPGFSIWIQLGIFFGCLGWSSFIAALARLRYDSGVFLAIMVVMLILLLVYLFVPSGATWEYYANNFKLGIRGFLVLGGLLWLFFFVRNVRALAAGRADT